MYRLASALKGHREAGSLNDQIHLFGFVDDHTFLTKTGDVGVILAVKGVDYECLATSEIDNYTKRLTFTGSEVQVATISLWNGKERQMA